MRYIRIQVHLRTRNAGLFPCQTIGRCPGGVRVDHGDQPRGLATLASRSIAQTCLAPLHHEHGRPARNGHSAQSVVHRRRVLPRRTGRRSHGPRERTRTGRFGLSRDGPGQRDQSPRHHASATPRGRPLPTDRQFLHGLFLSSTARAYLDNLPGITLRPRRGADRTMHGASGSSKRCTQRSAPNRRGCEPPRPVTPHSRPC